MGKGWRQRGHRENSGEISCCSLAAKNPQIYTPTVASAVITHADKMGYKYQEFKTMVNKNNLLIILTDSYVPFPKSLIAKIFAKAKHNTKHRTVKISTQGWEGAVHTAGDTITSPCCGSKTGT